MPRDPMDVARDAHEAQLSDYAEGVVRGMEDKTYPYPPPWVDDYDRAQRITDEEFAE